MLKKRVLLIKKDGRQWWLDQKANGTLWEAEQEVFASEKDAQEKGWKVDAVKVVFDSPDGKPEG